MTGLSLHICWLGAPSQAACYTTRVELCAIQSTSRVLHTLCRQPETTGCRPLPGCSCAQGLCSPCDDSLTALVAARCIVAWLHPHKPQFPAGVFACTPFSHLCGQDELLHCCCPVGGTLFVRSSPAGCQAQCCPEANMGPVLFCRCKCFFGVCIQILCWSFWKIVSGALPSGANCGCAVQWTEHD